MIPTKWIYQVDELSKEHNDIVGKKCGVSGRTYAIPVDRSLLKSNGYGYYALVAESRPSTELP